MKLMKNKLEVYNMKKSDQIYIDELLLNVLGEKFFHQKNLKIKYIPTVSRSSARNPQNINLKDVS